ncbi:MAG: hypothetical protein Q8N89_08345 [Azonexus sp.]|nr:hypothetical protein [Azonexus sp.]
MKRPFSFFLAVLIGWGSVTQPARAFVPPLIYAAYMTASVSGATYTMAALAGAIGITGMYLTIKDAQDNAVRVPLSDKPESVPPAPAAPASAQTVIKSLWGAGCPGSTTPMIHETRDGACSAAGGTSITYDGVWLGCRDSGGNTCSVSNGWVVSCPSGYTMSNGSCVISNPRQATDDKACDILLSNGQFATASDMNCGATADGTKIAPMIRDGKVIAYGTNSSGQPLMWEVTPGAQTYTVKEIQQIQTATQTQIKTTTATIDATTSAVTSVQTQTAPGSMSSPTAATAPTVTTDPTTATNTPTVTQDQTKPADLQTCGLPGTPACNIDDSQFDGKDSFTTPRNSEINDKLDQNKTQLENSKDSLPTIGTDWLPSLMPGNVTACAPLVFDFTLHNRITGTLAAPNVQLDICDKLELVRAILGYMLGVWTVWYVWRRFTTVNQGA